MYDFGKLPGPSSKWRRVTPDQRLRAAEAADKFGREVAAALHSGQPITPPPPKRRVCGDGRAGKPLRSDEIAGLRMCMGTHGRDIADILNAAPDEGTALEIARAYRNVVQGAPRAHETWGALLSRLCKTACKPFQIPGVNSVQ